MHSIRSASLAVLIATALSAVGQNLEKGTHIALIGGNLGSRMQDYGAFETELHVRYPALDLYVRNMCDGGDAPGWRPHPGRRNNWAFPGAETFHPSRKNTAHWGDNVSPDQWLARHKADVVIALFGYSESFAGPAGLTNFRAELDAFAKHTLKQKYNGETSPQLILVSPVAYQDRSATIDVPKGDNGELGGWPADGVSFPSASTTTSYDYRTVALDGPITWTEANPWSPDAGGKVPTRDWWRMRSPRPKHDDPGMAVLSDRFIRKTSDPDLIGNSQIGTGWWGHDQGIGYSVLYLDGHTNFVWDRDRFAMLQWPKPWNVSHTGKRAMWQEHVNGPWRKLFDLND